MKIGLLAFAMLPLALVMGDAQAQAKLAPGSDGFLCCNMRTDGGWISDANYEESIKTMIPYGTPLKFRGLGRNRANIEIQGKRQSIGNDYSRNISPDEFAARYIVLEDPRVRAAGFPAKIRNAIESAKVTNGMTREQVAMALGWPIASETPSLDAPVWKYWLWSFSPFQVHFNGRGIVTSVTGDAETLSKVYQR